MKIILTFCIPVVYLLPIVFAFVAPTYWLNSHYFPDHEHIQYASFYYLIYPVTWILLGLLMRYEHSRSRYEVWYCHKLFWSLNLVFVFVTDVLYYTALTIPNQDKHGWPQAVMTAVELIPSFIMVVLLCMTKSK